MKKTLLISGLLLFFTVKIFAQQFSQYNTNTLYDSFENPSQRVFIPDSSKQFAFNLFVPNLSAMFQITGDAQASLKSRYFLNKYNNAALRVDSGRFNHVNLNVNVYWIMAKMFTSLNGDEELGFSAQTKAEGRGLISDESIAILNGVGSFLNATSGANIFNGNYYFQTYHQVSLTYREKINKQFAFGVKLSALLGIQYSNLNVQSSNGIIDFINNEAAMTLQGRYYGAYIPGGNVNASDYLPTLRNPGAAISIGSSYRTEDGFFIQGNVKDLGFIHWSSRSDVYNFNNGTLIQGLATTTREDSVYNGIKRISHHNPTEESFTTNINSKAELSVNKKFWLDDNKEFKYSPTLIASKDFFDPGFVAALVNPVQYKEYTVTATATYNDLKVFAIGGQFMYKTPDFEVFFGSDELYQSIGLLRDAIKSPTAYTQNSSFTGASFYLGFALKFGPVVEHPMNSSSIPDGEKGFLGRLIGRWFKTTD